MGTAGSDNAKRLFALLVVDPSQWRAEVKAALMAHRSIPRAAAELGISDKVLRTWHAQDGELKRVRVAGRGRPSLASLSAEEIRELIAQAGGLAKAAEALGLATKRLDEYAATAALPAHFAKRLRKLGSEE